MQNRHSLYKMPLLVCDERLFLHEWFTEGFDTADLRDAKALLDELEK